MPVMWYVVRVILSKQGKEKDAQHYPALVQVVSCSHSEKAAQAQLEKTREAVDMKNIKHYYTIWESAGNNIKNEVETHLSIGRNAKHQQVGEVEIEEYY